MVSKEREEGQALCEAGFYVDAIGVMMKWLEKKDIKAAMRVGRFANRGERPCEACPKEAQQSDLFEEKG